MFLEHLGYEKHAPQGSGTGNNRNGYSTKRLKGQHGEVTIQAPRDRNASFEPQFVRKGQSHLTQMDDQILALYTKGLSTRDIVDAFKEMYDADISAGLVSKVTERVIEHVHEWQNRPRDPLYPIVYLDRIVLKIRANQRVINKSLYLALGINMEGHKELLGLWLAETEGAKVGGNEVLPTLLNRLRREIEQVSADGAYDTKECHALLKRKGARATIRPRKNAALWEEGHPLNEAVLALKAGELKEWKRASGYHQRSKAETAMYRFKQLISSKLSLRNYNAQVGEALAGVKAMNKMTVLGMPVRQLVN